MDIARISPLLSFLKDTTCIEDHFFHEDTTKWTTTATDSGTSTINDAATGTITLAPSDGTVADNDEIYFLTAAENFLFANDKHLYAECRIQFTEANTDDANVMFGCLNAVAANAILDDAGGIRATGSGVGFYKIDGGTKWICLTMMNGTQTTTTTNTTAGGASNQVLAFQVNCVAGQISVAFFIDGAEAKDSNNRPIVHNVTIASATEMHGFVGAKNGGANNESIVIDRIHFTQAH